MLADGQYSGSRKYPDNGELTHYFSYPGESDTDYFVQTGRIDSYFLADGEDINALLSDLSGDIRYLTYDRYTKDYPLDAVDNYPDDVTMSRQVLYFEDYMLLFDEMNGDELHDYEVVFTTPRLPDDVNVDSVGQVASWTGVEASYSRARLRRNPDESDYVSSADAKRRVRIKALNSLDSFEKGGFHPERYIDYDLGYVRQVQLGKENAQFLTVISSDDNQVGGDELGILTESVDGGIGAVVSPFDGSYDDVLIVHELESSYSVVNGVGFGGKLAVARLDGGGSLTDFYVREGTNLGYDGKSYFNEVSGDIYHLALSYDVEDIKGSIEASSESVIEIYSDFNPTTVELEKHPENYPFVDSTIEIPGFTYSDNKITVTIPQGSGSIRIF
jgi:hypothetical protein